MITTPSANSSFLAGIGFWAIVWSFAFKIDAIVGFVGFKTHLSDRVLAWVNRNKIITLTATEAVNFGVHGMTNPLAVTVALGGTIINALMIFVVIPMRMMLRSK